MFSRQQTKNVLNFVVRYITNILGQQQVNLVVDDAVEYVPDPNEKGKVIKVALHSEILLNGNQIAVLVPGGEPPADSLAETHS